MKSVEDKRAYNKEWYAKNRDNQRVKHKAWLLANTESEKLRKRECGARLKKANKAFVAEYFLTHHCVDCGESDPIVLEFDHVRGTKLYNISNMHRRHKTTTIADEISKCDVRCANCHRRATYCRRLELAQGGISPLEIPSANNQSSLSSAGK